MDHSYWTTAEPRAKIPLKNNNKMPSSSDWYHKVQTPSVYVYGWFSSDDVPKADNKGQVPFARTPLTQSSPSPHPVLTPTPSLPLPKPSHSPSCKGFYGYWVGFHGRGGRLLPPRHQRAAQDIPKPGEESDNSPDHTPKHTLLSSKEHPGSEAHWVVEVFMGISCASSSVSVSSCRSSERSQSRRSRRSRRIRRRRSRCSFPGLLLTLEPPLLLQVPARMNCLSSPPHISYIIPSSVPHLVRTAPVCLPITHRVPAPHVCALKPADLVGLRCASAVLSPSVLYYQTPFITRVFTISPPSSPPPPLLLLPPPSSPLHPPSP
ncbi:unnamed protein product [Pleuronectes platessa]|uniref:Uncharacterized protein n=1 Tax=Pleuronectes platessa TaxID=8262 RepID=A0A9N7U7U5_PLEPL|nr:unnamed protein product [Pleuronectes platessa]